MALGGLLALAAVGGGLIYIATKSKEKKTLNYGPHSELLPLTESAMYQTVLVAPTSLTPDQYNNLMNTLRSMGFQYEADVVLLTAATIFTMNMNDPLIIEAQNRLATIGF